MSKGKFTYYPNKVQKPVTLNFTSDSRDILQRLERATKASRTDLIEHAWRKMSGLVLNVELEDKVHAAQIKDRVELARKVGVQPIPPAAHQ